MKQYKADFLIFLATAIWGASFVVSGKAMATPWAGAIYSYLAARFWLGGAVLAIIWILQNRQPLSKKIAELQPCWIPGFWVALALAALYVLQTFALVEQQPTTTAFIMQFSVVLVPLVSRFYFKKALHYSAYVGALVSITGVGIMSLHGDLRISYADFLAFLCAATFTWSVFVIDHYAAKLPALAFTLTQVICLAALLTIIAILFEVPKGLPAINQPMIIATLYGGILATALAFYLYTRGQAHTSATHTAVIFALDPVLTAVAAWLWPPHEPFTFSMMVGGALIVAATLIVELGSILSKRTQESVTMKVAQGE